jgi:predicted metal-dependent hydrolase
MARNNNYLEFDGIRIEVLRKEVKNINLRVSAPDGRVRVSVPHRVGDDVVLQFLNQRKEWIRRKQALFANQSGQAKPNYVSGETHYWAGKAHTLEVHEQSEDEGVHLRAGDILALHIRPHASAAQRAALLDAWYRTQLSRLIPPLIAKWEPIMGVQVAEWRIRRMKTRWGTCSIHARRIWINLELAKYTPACLEYIVVHEMVHLLEKGHNKRFYGFMDRFLPNWRETRVSLNRGLGQSGPPPDDCLP